MGNEWLKLNIKQKCKGPTCSCKSRFGGFIAEKEDNTPTRGYKRYIHRLKSGKYFILDSVKYFSITNNPQKTHNVKNVSVYYDSEDRPFIIEVNRQNGTDYYTNNNPSNSQDEDNDWGVNLSWTQDSSLSDSQKLKDKLDELSCLSTGSISLDIYRSKLRSYCISSKVGFEGTFFTDETDFYEFKQFTNGQPFRVPYLRYNGKDLPIQMPREDIKEVSTFYWKHNFGKPLIVKVNKQSGETEYHFKDGRSGWTKKRVQDLNSTVLESNCLRNKATKIDLSRKYGKYCCTSDCKFERVEVGENKLDEVFPGFTSYEHKARFNYPFTIGKIINNRLERQIGFLYPICDIYELTVYYCINCADEPLLIYMSYKVDEFMEYTWYKRVTKNGWELVKHMPEDDEGFYKSLKEHLENLSVSLGDKCNLSGFHDDDTRFPAKKDDKVPPSPQETYIQLMKIARKENTPLPKGPPQNEKEEEEERVPGKRNPTFPPPKKSRKVYPITVKELQQIKQKVEGTPAAPALMVSPSGVIIDIKKDTNGQETTYPDGVSDQKVKLEKSVDPLNSGFVKFTHKPPSEGSFTVAQVVFGGSIVSDIGANTDENIQHLSVWYWSGDSGHNQPLLAEVKKQNDTFFYSYNKGGNSWQPLSGYSNPQPKQLTGKTLEAKLDHLNCNLNQAVTITLTFELSSHLSANRHNRKNTYCCNYHNPRDDGSQGNISVNKGGIVVSGTKRADYYKHTISGNHKLARIRYYIDGIDTANTNNSKTRRRIKISGLDFPTSNVQAVSAFYCRGNPVLIYVEGNGQNEWYKKPTGGNSGISGDEQWAPVLSELNGITPEDITNCTNFNKVKGVLSCASGIECKEPASPSLPRGVVGKGGKGDRGEQTDTDHKSPAGSSLQGATPNSQCEDAAPIPQEQRAAGPQGLAGNPGLPGEREAGKALQETAYGKDGDKGPNGLTDATAGRVDEEGADTDKDVAGKRGKDGKTTQEVSEVKSEEQAAVLPGSMGLSPKGEAGNPGLTQRTGSPDLATVSGKEAEAEGDSGDKGDARNTDGGHNDPAEDTAGDSSLQGTPQGDPQPGGGAGGTQGNQADVSITSGDQDGSTAEASIGAPKVDPAPPAPPRTEPFLDPATAGYFFASGGTALATGATILAVLGASGSITGFAYWISQRFAGEPWVRQI
ncbi:hypothetical protein BEWA_049230 [Theileria equi strain WA]|uniref:Uncharacterized protein n=1 Tax=Theileria equi strain WA TaxID=1537102 RepID=L1LAU9_THEEQ|nr:hypothetical protein BEWA_049230 [Theileria equi strain WA]EKX72456.1 hypothetical protein BEWA_049230 [Theileria equi strain WA]|eukprot:XP_004831908.1 hypothetical protein BEWA_049230 [Theileria equi strain WA]